MDVEGGKFYSRQAVLCGHPIEAEYYSPATSTKGGRIIVKDICAICYIADDLVAPNEIRKWKNVGRKHLSQFTKASWIVVLMCHALGSA